MAADTTHARTNTPDSESDRWTSEDSTVERRDRETRNAEQMEGSDDAGGVSNPPLSEDLASQNAVPDRQIDDNLLGRTREERVTTPRRYDEDVE